MPSHPTHSQDKDWRAVGDRPPTGFDVSSAERSNKVTGYFFNHHESAFQVSFGQMLDSQPIKSSLSKSMSCRS